MPGPEKMDSGTETQNLPFIRFFQPPMQFSNVDFPEPDLPIIATMLPVGTCIETSTTALTCPLPEKNVLLIWESSSIAKST